MSRFRVDDDFFSPVRFDTSIAGESVDSSEGSLNLSNVDEFLLMGAVSNKVNLEKSVIKSTHENELKSKDVLKPESVNTHTPDLHENSSDKSNAKKHASNPKLEKRKDPKAATVRKEENKHQQKTQSILDSHTPKSDTSEKLRQRKPKSSSLPLKNDNTKHDSLRDVKKRQKGNNQCSKPCEVNVILESSSKQSVEKKLIDSCSNSLESISDIKLKDSSSMSKENILKNKGSGKVSQQIEKLTVNPHQSSYESSIEKMVRSSICSESAKIRQLMYMQQMSFYREMNKMKDKMEKQHLLTTERLFKVIEELMQMKASLKLALSNKD